MLLVEAAAAVEVVEVIVAGAGIAFNEATAALTQAVTVAIVGVGMLF